MSATVLELRIPPRGAVPERELWSRPSAWCAFDSVPLVNATDGTSARHATEARVAWDAESIHLHVRCRDEDIWATHLVHDAPLWEEEVVEWFVAPGGSVPSAYAELEWNPHGALFDAWVDNPEGDRRTMTVDRAWSARGLRWAVQVDRAASLWTVQARLPWSALGLDGPSVLRANLHRIERPRGGEAEFQAWSPTGASPPDFHRPERFGLWVPAGS